jgi:Fic family protein
MVNRDTIPNERAGTYVSQPGGYKAFIPKPLPPEPPIGIDDKMMFLLSKADIAVGRLDASTHNLPDPDFFVYMYVLREAEKSSQIEGTQATFNDALEAKVGALGRKRSSDVDEIFNYMDAMNYGIERLRSGELPLCLRLIREIHERLLHGVRGENRQPGQFRKNQNYIGPEGCTVNTATFVPPPANEMNTALNNLEAFLHGESLMPVLIKAAIVHAQFETIHPFTDGNGRVGRLLITLFLCWQNVLIQPLLYLSHYFKNNRMLYYDSLQAIRDRGQWEEWIKFFLQGVCVVAEEASLTAKKIIALREGDRILVQRELGRRSNLALKLLDELYKSLPIISVKKISEILKVTPATANRVVKDLVKVHILFPKDDRKRNRIFTYQKYYDLLTQTG